MDASLKDASFIVREPLLEPSGAVAGYELSLQRDGEPVSLAAGKAQSGLDAFIASQFESGKEGQFGDATIVMAVRPQWLGPSQLASLPARRTIFRIAGEDMVTDAQLATLKGLRSRGFGVAVRDLSAYLGDPRLVPLATHVEVDYAGADFGAQVKALATAKPATTRMVVRNVATWLDFDVCAGLQAQSFIGNLYLSARPDSRQKGLNPAQTMILQMMELVRQNAEVRQLENVLKREPAIAYKLLRYINSVGFGLGAEIQSLRHAVTMLGYSPLYRWLSLLLATASTTGYSPALMQAAIIRGRFVELLGQGFLPKAEAENLFVAGMFSLLDRLLGVPMAQVLESIQLSDAVSEALLNRRGVYGPFLALAEACELHNGHVGELAEALFIDAHKVNEAHLGAISWAQSLSL